MCHWEVSELNRQGGWTSWLDMTHHDIIWYRCSIQVIYQTSKNGSTLLLLWRLNIALVTLSVKVSFALHNGGGTGIGKAINSGFGLVLNGSHRIDEIIKSLPLRKDTMGGLLVGTGHGTIMLSKQRSVQQVSMQGTDPSPFISSRWRLVKEAVQKCLTSKNKNWEGEENTRNSSSQLLL